MNSTIGLKEQKYLPSNSMYASYGTCPVRSRTPPLFKNLFLARSRNGNWDLLEMSVFQTCFILAKHNARSLDAWHVVPDITIEMELKKEGARGTVQARTEKKTKKRKPTKQKKGGEWRNVPKETAAIHWNINGLVGWLMLGQQERPQIWQKTVLTWLNRDPVASVPTPLIVNTCSFKSPCFFRIQVSYRWERKHFRAVQKVIKPRRFQVHKQGGGTCQEVLFFWAEIEVCTVFWEGNKGTRTQGQAPSNHPFSLWLMRERKLLQRKTLMQGSH